jgi:hypothetical protein
MSKKGTTGSQPTDLETMSGEEDVPYHGLQAGPMGMRPGGPSFQYDPPIETFFANNGGVTKTNMGEVILRLSSSTVGADNQDQTVRRLNVHMPQELFFALMGNRSDEEHEATTMYLVMKPGSAMIFGAFKTFEEANNEAARLIGETGDGEFAVQEVDTT